jgi:hypothetical protein
MKVPSGTVLMGMKGPAAVKSAVMTSVPSTLMSGAGAKTALAPAVAYGVKGAAAISGAGTTSGVVINAAITPGVAAALGLGLAAYGLSRWLALGSLGVAVAGLYFFARARRIVAEEPEFELPYDGRHLR